MSFKFIFFWSNGFIGSTSGILLWEKSNISNLGALILFIGLISDILLRLKYNSFKLLNCIFVNESKSLFFNFFEFKFNIISSPLNSIPNFIFKLSAHFFSKLFNLFNVISIFLLSFISELSFLLSFEFNIFIIYFI